MARSTFPSQNVQSTRGSDHFWRFRCRNAIVARSTFPSQNVKNTRGLDHFWRFRCRFASLRFTRLHHITLHSTTLHYTTLHYITLHYTPQHYNYTTTLHYTPLDTPLDTPLHSTTLNYTTLHYITLHYTPLHYTTLHYATFRYTTTTQPHRNNHMLQNTRGGTKTTAAATAAHRRYLSSPAAATLQRKMQGFVLRLPPQHKPINHSCSHCNAFCSTTYTSMQPLQCDSHPLVAEHRGGKLNDLETIQAATAAHARYLSSPAAATLHGKMQGFVLRLPPQNKAHATFVQPLQCVLQHDVANRHASTHMATPDDNNHAAIPMRSATTDSRNA